MSTPLFQVGQKVYYRESAAQGFLEAVEITAIAMITNDKWIYSTTFSSRSPRIPTIGDRIDLTSKHLVWYSESEFTDYCGALDLAIDNQERILAALNTQKQSFCSGGTG